MSITNPICEAWVSRRYGNGICGAPPTPEGDGTVGTMHNGQAIGRETATFWVETVVVMVGEVRGGGGGEGGIGVFWFCLSSERLQPFLEVRRRTAGGRGGGGEKEHAKTKAFLIL